MLPVAVAMLVSCVGTYGIVGNLVFDGVYWYQYDGWNRLVQVNDAGELETTDFLDDGYLDPESEHDPGDPVARFVYDGLGRLTFYSTHLDYSEPIDEHVNRHLYYDAVRRVSELTQYLEELAANSPCREYWESLVDVLNQVFRHRKRPSELIQVGNQHDDRLITNLAYLGSTLHPEVSLETAAVGHLAVLSSSVTLFDVVIGAERRIVVPFVEEYWRRAFDRERFRFSAPSEVDRSLQVAAGAPANERTRSVLRAITTGLGVRVPDYARSWLFGTDSDNGAST